jgi:hypothetical protein
MEGTLQPLNAHMTGEKRNRVQALLDTLERNDINREGILMPRALDNIRTLENAGRTQDPWTRRRRC